MEMEEGQLVESGSFKVDRAKALEKIIAYQLEKPGLFTLSWVRTAVASGANNISYDFDEVVHPYTILCFSAFSDVLPSPSETVFTEF